MRFVRFAGIREKKVEKSGIFYVKIEKSFCCIRYLAYFFFFLTIRIMETRNNINPRPFQPVSPGCILKEELEARSLPISDFAHKIGLEEFELDKLLNGTLCLSPEIASSLERFLGIPASFWLSLQSAYEEDLDKSDNKGMVRTFLNFVAPK